LFGQFDSGNFFRVFSVSGNFRKVRSGIKNSGHLGDTTAFSEIAKINVLDLKKN